MEVLISNRQKLLEVDLEQVREVAIEIMKFEASPENAELSIVFCDDDFIQKLNKDYRGKSEPTDVLSFPIDEENFEPEIRLLGDIVISVETALRQADSLKHPPMLEIVFLLIHGLLHLHGYDHILKVPRRRMRDREVTIFRHLCDKKLLACLDDSSPDPIIKRVNEND
ncbi:MAG TPA: rRNA maturation RNase YbeY [Candidatus Rifleibacterium sp.]|nr:rRNA maturation RNase YbeY [Candidatus Rifleibacterium sp.]HPT45500.1 rRNA maturation RNase YbeY [Candidatus Rifleibacterium sp.]